MRKSKKWPAYNELAWVDHILASPEDTAEECDVYFRLINENTESTPETMLHLGCGGGLHDYNFKKHFSVTGVDISEGMIKCARELNPEIHYIMGDMRTIRLPIHFDVVIIPDSIGYITSLKDLEKTIETAVTHMKGGGILLITVHLKEEFQENNFVYTGAKDDVSITLFENNTIIGQDKDLYEAVMVYLIRKRGELTVHHDCHVIGLFTGSEWNTLFCEAGLTVSCFPLAGLYDRYLMGEGEYPMSVFVCTKKRS
jgi:SAM-dependent methyltransferase